MPSVRKTVRAFISSTFRDMDAERDHLVKVVFPALRERLEKHRIYLDNIDLRWGVTKEQAENDRVLDLCLREIERCQPFFLACPNASCRNWWPDFRVLMISFRSCGNCDPTC
jgi:hypothetical protein